MLEIAPDALPGLAGNGAQTASAAPESSGAAGEDGGGANEDGGPSGLVETERDRLIRLVGPLLSHWRVQRMHGFWWMPLRVSSSGNALRSHACTCIWTCTSMCAAGILCVCGAGDNQVSHRAALIGSVMSGLQGVLTPFDNLSGFERKVRAQQPSAAAQRSAGEPSTSGVGLMVSGWWMLLVSTD